MACPAPFAKIFLFSPDPNHFHIPAILSRERGVGHRHERWGGMRWTRAALKTKAPTLRTEKSCGPDASTLASSSWEASFSGAMVTKKPDRQGERGGNR